MTGSYLIVLGVIAVLSVVQSVFGMGILVFGTPTLILMGYDFLTTLQYLLPASVAISLIQTISSTRKGSVHKRALLFFCMPAICAGLFLSSVVLFHAYIELVIGIMLLISACLRSFPSWEMRLRRLARQHVVFAHTTMGLVHGITNLGGAILAVYAAATNKTKQATRHAISAYYLAFGTIQMLVLSFLGYGAGLAQNYLAPIISAAVYFSVGNSVFLKTDETVYNRALTAFIALYGAVVVIRVGVTIPTVDF